MKRASAPLSQYRYLVNSWGVAETFGFQKLDAAQKFIKRRGVQWYIREWNGRTFALHSESVAVEPWPRRQKIDTPEKA